MPLELRSPAGLALLGLIVPLVVLYILKVRRQRLRVPSTWLWSAARRDLLARSPFRRLLVQVPLILQLVALALLGLAFSRPATRGGAIVGDHVAIVIDSSASMASVDRDGKRRIEHARKAARDVIAALGPGSDALVVEAGREPRVASPLDRDRRRLEAAVDRIDAGDVEGHLGKAVALAGERLRQLAGSQRIVVVTDGAIARPEGIAESVAPVDLVLVGEPADNTAIVRVDVRSGVDPATRQDQVQAFAVVASFAERPRDVFVTLRQKDVVQPIASRKLRLAPGERSPVVLTFAPERGDLGTGLVVELSPGDALAADDRAYGRVPPSRRIPVVMAPPDANPWFRRALAADPDVELIDVSLPDLVTGEKVPPDALVVVDGVCPERLPGADFLILDPPQGRCGQVTVGRQLEKPSITSWREGDARLRFVALDGITLLGAKRIETDGPDDALIRAGQGPIAADVSSPGRTGTLLGFDAGDSSWPLKASFVLFVRNLVELARAHRQSGLGGPARTGEPLRASVPADVSELAVEGPDGKRSKIAARAGLAVVPDVARAGFYHLSWQGARPGSVLVAANLASEAESDTRPRELPVARGSGARRAEQLADAFTDWTWLLAALALAFIGLDVWWLTRRPRLTTPGEVAVPRLPERRPA